MKETGLIHIYCGDGKGKTTAAMGLALRCAGRGFPVVVAQFLKDGTSGECRVLAKLDNVTLFAANPCGKFSWQLADDEKSRTAGALRRMFEAASGLAVKTNARLLVLDEVCGASAAGLLDERALLDFLDSKPKGLEVVITGRNPSDKLLGRADYITEMVKKKHPYDKGIAAREGIEL